MKHNFFLNVFSVRKSLKKRGKKENKKMNVFSVSSYFPPQIIGNLLLFSILKSDFH